MFLIISHKWWTEREDTVREFCCPTCQAVGPAHAALKRYTAKLFWLIPVWVSKTAEIHCHACGAIFKPSVPYEQAIGLSGSDLKAVVAPQVKGVVMLLVVLGWLMICAPVLPMVMFGFAAKETWKTNSGWKWAAIVGLVLSVLCSLLYVPIMLEE